jgi:hypothetical protein
MNVKNILVFALISISRSSLAIDICIVGAGIGNEDGQFTYMTGIGPEGADPKPIKPMNIEIQKSLESAAKKMDPAIQFCMTGKKNKNIFEVSAVNSKKLN